MSEVETKSADVSILQRVRQILIEPSEAIRSDVLRMKTRLLSFALLLIVIVFPIVQVGLGLLFSNLTLFVYVTSIFLAIYIISRSKYAVLAGIITTLVLALMR
ncbi:MAG: hypothetical protein ACXACG_09275 [Candidatus Thorarchaeota archaeon]|jgi:hypothetical protein